MNKSMLKIFLYSAIIFIFIPSNMQSATLSRFWGQEIKYIRFDSIDRQSLNVVKEAIDIKEGDILSIQKIRSSLRHLNLLHQYDEVTVSANKFLDGCMVIFKFRPSWSIRKLSISITDYRILIYIGYGSLNIPQLKRNLPLKENEPFSLKKLKNSISKLEKALFDAGFGLSEIHYKIRKDSGSKKLDVLFKIDSGIPTRIESITFDGNAKLSNASLLRCIRSKSNNKYSRSRAEQDVDRIRKCYLKKYFLEVKVYQPKIYFDKNKNTVHLTFKIDEGIQLPVSLEVPYHFWNLDWWIYKLEPHHQSLFEILGYSPSDMISYNHLKNGLMHLIEEYKNHGFYHADGEIFEKQKKSMRTFILHIDEGEKVTIHKIKLQGNHYFQSDILKPLIFSKENRIFRKNIFDADIESIKAYYIKAGFIDVAIRPHLSFYHSNKSKVDIAIHIEEGRQYLIKEILFEGNHSYSSAKLLEVMSLKEGNPFNPQNLDRCVQRMINFYHSNGYAEVIVRKEISSFYKSWEKSIRFIIEEGISSVFDKVIVTGYKKTQYSIIQRNIPSTKGKPYSTETLFEIQKSLSSTGLFSLVRTKTFSCETGHKNRTVLVYVKEFPSLTLEGGPGYDTDAGANGYLSFYTTSLYGTNRYLGSSIFLSGKAEKSQLIYREPEFAGFPIQMEIRFIRNNKDETQYRLLRTGVRVNWTYHFNSNVRTFLEYRLDNDRPSNIEEGVLIPEEYRNSVKIGSLSPGILYDTRDDPRDPHSGGLYSFKVEFARPVYSSEVDFTKTTLEFIRFLNLKHERILGLSFRLGWGRDLPYQERFKLGGIKTIRGWDFESIQGEINSVDGAIYSENSFGGNFSTLVNCEFRFPLFWSLQSVLFLDIGNVWSAVNSFDVDHLKGTCGLGIRFMTPVGPVGIDYGYNIMKEHYDPKDRWSFVIGHTF